MILCSLLRSRSSHVDHRIHRRLSSLRKTSAGRRAAVVAMFPVDADTVSTGSAEKLLHRGCWRRDGRWRSCGSTRGPRAAACAPALRPLFSVPSLIWVPRRFCTADGSGKQWFLCVLLQVAVAASEDMERSSNESFVRLDRM